MKPIQLSVWTPDSQAAPGDLPAFTRALLEALRRASPGANLVVYAPGHVGNTVSSSDNIRFTSRSLRTIRPGLCRLRFVFEFSPPHHGAAGTPTPPGPDSWEQANRA